MAIALVMPYNHLILWCLLLLCPRSFPESGTFPMSCLFASGDQNTGASASASVLAVNIQCSSPLRLTVWYPCCPRDFQESSPVPQFKGINSLAFCLLYGPALTTKREYWEDKSLDYMDLCRQSNVSAFQHTVYVCHRFPANHLLISWLQSPSAVILEPKKRKSVTTSTFSPSICHEVVGLDAMILVF